MGPKLWKKTTRSKMYLKDITALLSQNLNVKSELLETKILNIKVSIVILCQKKTLSNNNFRLPC